MRTATRVIRDLGIPPADVWVIAPGIVAVKPAWRSAVRAKYADQPWYNTWLDRGYMASESGCNPDQYCAVLHKGPGNVGSPSLAAQADKVVSYPVAIKCGDTYTSENTSLLGGKGALTYSWENANAIGGRTSTLISPSDPMSVAIYKTTSLGMDWGTFRTFTHRPNFNGENLQPNAGYGTFEYPNVQGVTHGRGKSTFQLTTNGVRGPKAGGRTDWPLISGPAILTRGEYYPNGVTFIAATAVEACLLLDQMIAAATDRNDKNALQLKRDSLFLMGEDVLVRATVAKVNPFDLYSKTKPFAQHLMSLSGVVDGFDFDLFRSNMASTDVVYGVAPVRDPIPFDSLPDWFDELVEPIVLNVNPSNKTVVPGYPTSLTVPELYDLASSLKSAGKSFTVSVTGDVSLFTNDETLIVGQIKDLASAPAQENQLVSIAPDGQHNAVGIATIGAYTKKPSASQLSTFRAILEPAVMDALAAESMS